MDFSEKAMMRCFQLAQIAGRNTQTNPMVGAVIAYQDQIIGEGYHMQFGKAHAEVNALQNVGLQDKHLIANSTLYVSLEPCSHHGKTPPCVEAIVKSGIRRVVIGTQDPSPKVAGNGIKFLKQHGVEVALSSLRQLAELLIQPFRTHMSGRPYIILKWAQSYDFYIGKKNQQIWISNEYSKFVSHCWRSESDGILIGKNTALTDNPQLTTRFVSGNNPVRILLDHHLEIPDNSRIFDGEAKTMVFNSIKEDASNSIVWIKYPPETPELPFVLKTLFDAGINYLIVEGGTAVLKSFISTGCWDEARYITSETMINEGIQAPTVSGYLTETYHLDTDVLRYVRNPNPRFELSV